MDRQGGAPAAVRNLGIGAAIGAIATLAGVVGWVRMRAGREVARASLWPRPDGSTRSFGEVWDITTNSTRPMHGRASRASSEGG